MKHKLYLSIQSFLTEFIFSTTLYGKYSLIDAHVDLVFHRRFVSLDEYLAWATRQVFTNLERFTRLLHDEPDIQQLYQIMDRARADVDILFEIEQLLRTILPLSLYIENKETIYENYFELIECYLEDILLFQSFSGEPLESEIQPQTEQPQTETASNLTSDEEQSDPDPALDPFDEQPEPTPALDPFDEQPEPAPAPAPAPAPVVKPKGKPKPVLDDDAQLPDQLVAERPKRGPGSRGGRSHLKRGRGGSRRRVEAPSTPPVTTPLTNPESDGEEEEDPEVRIVNELAMRLSPDPEPTEPTEPTEPAKPEEPESVTRDHFSYPSYLPAVPDYDGADGIFLREQCLSPFVKEVNPARRHDLPKRTLIKAKVKQYLLDAGSPEPWVAPTQEKNESDEQYRQRWTDAIYQYALVLRSMNIMLCPFVLKELHVNALELYYLVQRIVKYILCDYDGWTMQHISAHFILALSALCYMLDPSDISTRTLRPVILGRFLELHRELV